MFCDGCGASVQTGQAFCSRCGKQTIGPVTAIQPRPGRVQEHVHLLGILWLAISAFNTIGGVILFILANTLFAHFNGMGAPEAPTASVVDRGQYFRPWLRLPADLSPDGA